MNGMDEAQAMINEAMRGRPPDPDSLAAKNAEIAQLRAALTQLIAVCETAPPVSFLKELGMAIDGARFALTNGERT